MIDNNENGNKINEKREPGHEDRELTGVSERDQRRGQEEEQNELRVTNGWWGEDWWSCLGRVIMYNTI